MKKSELKQIIKEEIEKVLKEATVLPTSYDFNNPGDEWKNILTKAMQRFAAYPKNPKVIKDTANLIMAVYKLGGKNIGAKFTPDDLAIFAKNLTVYDDKVLLKGNVDDLITYIKNDLDPTGAPNWASPAVKKEIKAGNWSRIMPQTKLKVGDEVVRMKSTWFGKIVKINGDKYYIQFDADYAEDKPTEASRRELEGLFALMRKK
jgi:hypothetical protein